MVSAQDRRVGRRERYLGAKTVNHPSASTDTGADSNRFVMRDKSVFKAKPLPATAAINRKEFLSRVSKENQRMEARAREAAAKGATVSMLDMKHVLYL